MKFCSKCGASVSLKIPPGEERKRFVCNRCNTIHYQNPKMVVGCIPVLGDRLLMCKRAIEPRYGKWTLPAGFLEIGETVEQGAIRETKEEAKADVVGLRPFALYSIAHIGHIYMMFIGKLEPPLFGAGDESLEVRLMREDEIEMEDLAFPVIRETLKLFFKDRKKGNFGFHIGEISHKERLGPVT